MHSRTCHTLFHSFLSDHSKQYAATIASHSKQITDRLENSKILGAVQSNIWDNIDGCAEYYIFVTALYLLSMFFNIIIDHGISAPGYDREVVDGLNATYKRFIFHLMATF